MLWLVSLLLALLTGLGFPLERCWKYTQLVRKYHYYYFGVWFPYWFSVGQLEKESACRHKGVWSKDGARSYGLAQITWKVWKNELQRAGIYEIKTVKRNLKAQAYINYKAYKSAVCKKLWVMYQIYNGGTLVNLEIKRAGKCNWCEAYKHCRRKKVCFKNGQCISACKINYEYSLKIYNLGLKYKPGGEDETGEKYFW